MLDIKYLRSNINEAAEKLKTRGFLLDVALFGKLEAERKSIQTETQDIQAKKNENAKRVGKAKANGEDISKYMQEMTELSDTLKQKEIQLRNVQQEFDNYLAQIPNILHDSVPVGTTEDDNVELRTWGSKRDFDFALRAHEELGELSGNIDLKTAANLSGSRFMILKNNLARLHRALVQFMLDTHVKKHNYEEVYVPFLVKTDAMFGTGQLPKFREDQFAIENEDLWLIPTSEVPLTNMIRGRILKEADLPLKYTCHSCCFRREAGAYGKDTKGIFRQHQFDKVELVQIVTPEKSHTALEELTSEAEHILQELKLPYRVVVKCSGDTGFTATKTFDIEVWVPSQNKYREISSCSNTESFQSRRMLARFKNKSGKSEFCHTLNGSGVAIGRALIAVMENYQNEDGTISIPEVLEKYM